MTQRHASARWEGTLKEGKGHMKMPDAQYSGPFTFVSRFEEGEGTNPEELVGAAISGCFSMFLAALISKKDLSPDHVNTTATVHLGADNGPKITQIDLDCEASVSGLSDTDFQALVQEAKQNCPISRLYAGTTIHVSAKLS
ncbi:MAG: peroxiredoxin [Actinobacteria bacterium]|nr:peroxiredoxin [Actinomycetota bacterium]